MVSFRSMWNRLFTSVPPVSVPVTSQAPAEVSSIDFDDSPEFWSLPENAETLSEVTTRMSDSCVNLSRQSDGLGVKFECVHAGGVVEFVFPTSYTVRHVHDLLMARNWISVRGLIVRRNGVRIPLLDVCGELFELGMMERNYDESSTHFRLVSTIPVHIV